MTRWQCPVCGATVKTPYDPPMIRLWCHCGEGSVPMEVTETVTMPLKIVMRDD